MYSADLTNSEVAEIKSAFEDDRSTLGDFKKNRKALEIMAAWRYRTDKHPAILELSELVLRGLATDQLVQRKQNRILNSEDQEEDWSWIEHGNLQLIYSMGIIRFINFVSEMGQGRHIPGVKMTQPIHIAVSKHGVPEWLVQIRHSATHKEMPNLELLRNAAMFCRQWLTDKYWGREREAATKELEDIIILDDSDDGEDQQPTTSSKTPQLQQQQEKHPTPPTTSSESKNQDLKESTNLQIQKSTSDPQSQPLSLSTVSDTVTGIQSTLTTYQSLRNKILFGAANLNSKIFNALNNEFDSLLNGKITEFVRDYKELFLVQLVSDGNLILSPVQSANNVKSDGLVLPAILQRFWEPLLSLLRNFGCWGDLFLSLIRRVSENDTKNLSSGSCESSLAQIKSWLNLLLDATENDNQIFSRQIWTEACDIALFKPEVFDQNLVEKVIKGDPSMDRIQKEHLFKVVGIYSGDTGKGIIQLDSDDEGKAFKMVTSELVIKEFGLKTTSKEIQVNDPGKSVNSDICKTDTTHWLETDGMGIDWSKVPLGVAPSDIQAKRQPAGAASSNLLNTTICRALDEPMEVLFDKNYQRLNRNRLQPQTSGPAHPILNERKRLKFPNPLFKSPTPLKLNAAFGARVPSLLENALKKSQTKAKKKVLQPPTFTPTDKGHGRKRTRRSVLNAAKIANVPANLVQVVQPQRFINQPLVRPRQPLFPVPGLLPFGILPAGLQPPPLGHLPPPPPFRPLWNPTNFTP